MSTGSLSTKNPRLKRLRRLSREAKVRSQERAFVAEGLVLVLEALLAERVTVDEIFVDEEADPSVFRSLDEAIVRNGAGGVVYETVNAGGLASILSTVTPQPVAAVISMPADEIDQLDTDRPVLVLAELRDPGNVGTLMRTAEAAGFAGVVLAGASVDATNPKVVRAAAGARFRLPVITIPTIADAYEQLELQGRSIQATVVDSADGAGDPVRAATDYADVDLATAAIVLGNEAHGLDEASAAAAHGRITIQLAGPTESLNVAAAGAVLCFESLRQRRS